MSNWIYFGCHKEPGHYAFSEGMRPLVRRYGSKDVSRFDTLLPPQTDTAPYIATVSRLEGWGMTALAFWDYSVDKRRGCNSIVFAPSLTITPNELLAEAQTRFPQVFGRLPEPVRLLVPQPENKPEHTEAEVQEIIGMTMDSKLDPEPTVRRILGVPA